MKVLVLANEEQKKEWLTIPPQEGITLIWNESKEKHDACIDLLFEDDLLNVQQRVEMLRQINAPLVVINAVITTLKNAGNEFVRFNGWNSFLQRPIIEAVAGSWQLQQTAEQLFSLFRRKVEWTPDIPGFISARVVSSIINEAFLAMEENVSVEKEIDIAMKLGTNYPYGPFEWGEKIGLDKVVSLLQVLEKEKNRYKPSDLLIEKLLV